MNFLNIYIDYWKKIISPPFCFYCKIFLSDYSILCNSCEQKVRSVISKKIQLNKNNDLIVHAISNYNEPLKSLILAKSYSNYSASIMLAKLIWKLSALKNLEFDYFVPIPLHWTRYAWRGYNQSNVIAQELSRLSGKKTLHLVERSKYTPFQSSLPINQRKENVKDIFQLKQSAFNYKNKTFVLVDDLMTTGSTLTFTAKALLKLKPKQIHAIVGCRAI